MTRTQRILAEVLAVIILSAIAYGLWQWQENRRIDQLAEQSTRYDRQIGTLNDRAEFWAEGMAASEAQAVFRAFRAGLAPSLLTGSDEPVQQAATQLLFLPEIDFVHILRPDGEVIYTSDAKLVATGSRVRRNSWALGVGEMAVRESDTQGVTEVAGAVQGPEGSVAYLWIGYRTKNLLDELRPETFGQGGEPATGADAEAADEASAADDGA